MDVWSMERTSPRVASSDTALSISLKWVAPSLYTNVTGRSTKNTYVRSTRTMTLSRVAQSSTP